MQSEPNLANVQEVGTVFEECVIEALPER